MCSTKNVLKLLRDPKTKYYTETLDLLPSMVIIKDDSDTIVWVNRTVLKCSNKHLDQHNEDNRLMGEKTCTIIDFMPKDKYKKLDEEIILSGESILDTVDIISTPTHDNMVVRVDKIPFLDKEGNCIGVVTYIINLSETIESILTKYITEVEYQKLRVATKKLITKLNN